MTTAAASTRIKELEAQLAAATAAKPAPAKTMTAQIDPATNELVVRVGQLAEHRLSSTGKNFLLVSETTKTDLNVDGRVVTVSISAYYKASK